MSAKICQIDPKIVVVVGKTDRKCKFKLVKKIGIEQSC
jgi:hypothetical protein